MLLLTPKCNCYVSHDKNIMFYCYFDTIKCNWTDFEVYTSQRSEICYQFNTGKNVFNVTVDKRYMTRQGIDDAGSNYFI